MLESRTLHVVFRGWKRRCEVPSLQRGHLLCDRNSVRAHLAQCTKATPEVRTKAGDTTCGQKRKLPTAAASTAGASVVDPKQRRIEALPGVTACEKTHLEKAIGRFVFASGHAFSTVEDPLLLQLLQSIRPNLKKSDLPSRHTLGTRVLNEVYKEVADPLIASLSSAEQLIIQCDAWQSARKENVFAILAATAGTNKMQSLIIDAGVLTRKSHTSDELCSHLRQCDEDLLKKTICVVTDGDSTAVASAKKLAVNFPKMKTLVCGPHSVARCTNDCVGTRKSKGKESPNEFHPVAAQVTSVVASIRNTEYLSKLYEEKSTRSKKLVLPAVTRWTTMSETWAQVAALCTHNFPTMWAE